MVSSMEKYQCPVCGYPELKVKPYSFGLGSTEFCQCCGFQFGVTDDDYNVSHKEWRKVWIAKGSPCFSISQTRVFNILCQPSHQFTTLRICPLRLSFPTCKAFTGLTKAKSALRFTWPLHMVVV